MMETAPKYIFLGFLVVVIGAIAGIYILHSKSLPPEAPIQGAGSTFIDPLMVQWSSQYEKTESGCRIGYRSVGSGRGIQSVMEKKVDFGCTDAPLTDEQIAQVRSAGGEVVHVPLVLGAVVPVYNLATAKTPVRFTGAVLADIFLGKIKKWNDKALHDLNPDIELPDREITVVHRSDGSGTTYIWADYLSKTNPDWKKTVGVGTQLKWPFGTAESGNDGVAANVQKTSAAIGYVELTYALRLDLAVGLVENQEKEFVKANLGSITKAAENALGKVPDDLRYSLTDAPGKGSYPITGTTWAIVYVGQTPKKGRQLVDFLNWATGDGQLHVHELLYARLPEPLAAKARNAISRINPN
jgi:phosphate transport system substrate-binding protein